MLLITNHLGVSPKHPPKTQFLQDNCSKSYHQPFWGAPNSQNTPVSPVQSSPDFTPNIFGVPSPPKKLFPQDNLQKITASNHLICPPLQKKDPDSLLDLQCLQILLHPFFRGTPFSPPQPGKFCSSVWGGPQRIEFKGKEGREGFPFLTPPQQSCRGADRCRGQGDPPIRKILQEWLGGDKDGS